MYIFKSLSRIKLSVHSLYCIKGRSFGSVEEEALESFAALKKAQQMESELRQFVNFNYGHNAWNEVIRIQVNIRKKKKEAIAEAKRKQAQMIENTILGALVIFFLGNPMGNPLVKLLSDILKELKLLRKDLKK